jgi:outer membrane protein
MNNITIKKFIFFIAVAILCRNTLLSGQLTPGINKAESDSLSLQNVIKQVIAGYPTVKMAEEAITNADARISLAHTGYNPEIDMTASYSNMGPITKLTIPNMGTFQLYPENSYSAAINYKQTLYDFGRTSTNINLEKENKAIGEQTLEQVKQKLSAYSINNFYNIVYLQSAIKIKEEQIRTLYEHLNYVEKMMSTGSATEYNVLSTRVKISSTESQKVDMEASLAAQIASLNSLLGQKGESKIVLKNELSVVHPAVNSDSLLSYAYRNRDEVLINERKASLAEIKYDLTKLQNKPVLNLQASAGGKNGYVPYLDEIKPNYVVGLGLRVPIFDGMKTKYNLSQAKSAINTLSFETESVKRNISTEIIEAEENMNAAEKKVTQFQLQLELAVKAYSLAETSYKSGKITNLDLLDANTSVSESKLMLLKSKIDYAASVYRLKAALGDRLY